MQFDRRFKQRIRDGEVVLTFRAWRRPQAKAGGVYRLPPVGSIRADAVRCVEGEAVTDRDARRAGFDGARALLDDLAGALADPGRRLFRVDFTYIGEQPDALAALRNRPARDDERAQLAARLERMDERSRRGPWTAAVLVLIAGSPGRRAADLAAQIGWETPVFKTHVRRLKAIGLTESLETGYRLSRRGRALLEERSA